VLNCDRSTVKHALQNTQSDCYRWLSNSTKGHLIRFRPGLGPDPSGELIQRSSRPCSWFKEPTSKRRGGKGTRKEGRERSGKGRGGTGNGGSGREGVGMPGKGGKGKGREEEGEKKEEGRKVRTPLGQFLPTPLEANSAFHPAGVGKLAPASAGKAKAGMVHSVSGCTRVCR